MRIKNRKVHLVNLFKWRSTTACIACIVTIVLTVGSIINAGMRSTSMAEVHDLFEWFTIDSNFITGIATLMILPYTIEGISKKRLTYPKWLLLIHYSGAICTTVTFAFALGILSWYDSSVAFGNENIFLHIVCPILVLISFFMVESERRLTRRDTLIGLVPFTIYAFLYLFHVVVLKVWNDHYQLNARIPFYYTMPMMFLLAIGIAVIIRVIHNKILKVREQSLRQMWSEDLDDVSVKIEIYSLGYHAGLHQDEQDISIPFDILKDISKRFHIKLEELSKAYTKGVIVGLEEKKK